MKVLFLILMMTFFEDVYALDMAQNLAVQSLKKEQEASDAKEGHLRRSFLPELSFVAGEERFDVETIRARTEFYALIEARINLFRGGRDLLESEVFNLQSSLKKNQAHLKAREELNKIRKLQFDIIHNKELILILEKEKRQNQQILTQANRRAASGVATKTDALEFTIYDSELTEAIESLKHENKILKIGLTALVDLTEEQLSFPSQLHHQHDELLLRRVEDFKKTPKVANLIIEQEILSKERTMANRYWFPKVDLYGGHYNNIEMINRDHRERSRLGAEVIGVRLTMELFDGLKSSVEATSSVYKAEAKRLMARYVERESEAQFRMLKEDLIHTHEVMHYVLDRIKKSDDYLKLTLKEYDRGVKNSLDALTAMQRYYQYEKDYLKKKKEYHFIKADLLALLGE
jgi:outer membrane protein TolC